MYAYIEAKNTLYIDGEKGQSLKKACSQVQKAKTLYREKKYFHEMECGIRFPKDTIQLPLHWPNYQNPIFGCIISRKAASIEKNKSVNKINLLNHLNEVKIGLTSPPDLIIAGNNLVCLPAIKKNEIEKSLESSFFLPNESLYEVFETENNLSIGIISMLRALNYIVLKPINYNKLMANGLQAQYKPRLNCNN